MVKGASNAEFPENIATGVLERIFSGRNLHRLAQKAKRKEDAGNEHKFARLLRKRLFLWGQFDASLPQLWLEASAQMHTLQALFEKVQAAGGWRVAVGLSLWPALSAQLNVESSRALYEKFLSYLDPYLHPKTKVPNTDYFPPRKLANWCEVLSLRLPACDEDLKRVLALSICVFRSCFDAKESLATWANKTLLLIPLPCTAATVTTSREDKVVYNTQSLGVPLLIANCGTSPCDIEAHYMPFAISSAPARRFLLRQQPGDILFAQGPYCLTLRASKTTTVTRLSCLPNSGSQLLSLLDRSELCQLLDTQVPFLLYATVCDQILTAKVAPSSEEKYQLSVRLLQEADDWLGEELPPSSSTHCAICSKELFLAAWRCECGVTVCRCCCSVSARQRHGCQLPFGRVCVGKWEECRRTRQALEDEVKRFVDALQTQV